MYLRNCVLLFIAMSTILVSEFSFAFTPVETENEAKVLKHKGIKTPLLLEKTVPNTQPIVEDQLKHKLDQGLAEFRQTLLKQQDSITLLKQHLVKQSETISKQKQVLEKQNKEIQYLQSRILSQDRLKTQRATGINKANESKSQNTLATERPGNQGQEYIVAENSNSTTQEEKAATNKSRTEARPEIAAIPEIGGVLTPPGLLMLEPGIQASHSSFNQFTFLGAEIVDAFLVGLIQAEDTTRDLISPQLTARYGITSRLEAEFKIPYIYREDDVSGTVPQLQGSNNAPVTINRNFDGDGLGDIELALHYQINDGSDGWPFFIGNLRWKTVTGEGPFDVDRSNSGQENESPTGSGFHSLEPSLTILYPTDPAVIFANFGYLINFEEDVNKNFIQTVSTGGNVERQEFGTVDPGDSIRVSVGMGYSLNERTSLTLGYKHDFIDGTEFEINGTNVSSNDLSVGSLLLGWGFTFTPQVSANLNLELGITQDAPDVLMTLRVPFKAYQF